MLRVSVFLIICDTSEEHEIYLHSRNGGDQVLFHEVLQSRTSEFGNVPGGDGNVKHSTTEYLLNVIERQKAAIHGFSEASVVGISHSMCPQTINILIW